MGLHHKRWLKVIETFWHADAAALSAMSLAKEAAAQQIVADILATIYTPWLASTTLNFQRLVEQAGYPGSREVNEASAVYQLTARHCSLWMAYVSILRIC